MTSARRFTPPRIAAFIVLVVAFMVLDGSRKIPAPAASGIALNGPAPTSRPSGEILRVATFNIAGGVGSIDGRRDLDRTAAALAGYDLIGLQEVHGSFSGPDQAEIIGTKLNLQWLFAPVETQWWHEAFGDGILTALPVTHWQRIPLANAIADSNREVLWAQLEFNGRPLNVLITHLERHDDRTAELQTVIALFESLKEPAILMGDLNTPKDDPQLAQLRKLSGVADPISDSFDDKIKDSWDWIFARGLHAVRGGLISNGVSDHPLAWAEFQLGPS